MGSSSKAVSRGSSSNAIAVNEAARRGLAAASGAGTVLTLFWKLADTHADERLAAAADLIDILIHQQEQAADAVGERRRSIAHPATDQAELLEYEQHSPAACSDIQEARADRIIDSLCSPDVAYSLRRLVRGLASPRQGARQGFAVALAALLARLTDLVPLGPDVVLTLILKASASSKSAKPSEARELLFARIFGIHALFRSRLLFQDDDLDSDDDGDQLSPLRVMQGSNVRVFERTLDVILGSIAPAKTWIKQSATWLALQAIAGLLHIDSADLSWRDEAIEIVYSRVAASVSATRLDVDALALVIGLVPVLSPEQLKSLLCPPLSSPNLLAATNLASLARILKEAPAEDESEGKPGSSTWTPDLHLVWDQLLDIYYPPSHASHLVSQLRTGAAPFADFYRVVVDESLFSATSSPQRKLWGFTIVQNVLARLASKTDASQRIRDVPLLFQPNFVRTWINQLSDASRMLHKVARNTAQALLRTLQQSPAPAQDRSVAALALLTILLTPPVGLRAFDQVTKTRTIEGILATLDGSGLDQYVSFLENEILTPGSRASEDGTEGGGSGELDGRRRWAIDQLLAVVRFRVPASPARGGTSTEDAEHPTQGGKQAGALRDEGAVVRVLRFLARHGWFKSTSGIESSEGKGGDKKHSKGKKDKSGATSSRQSLSSAAPGSKLDASTRALLRSRFLSSVQDLNSLTVLHTEPDGKKHRVTGVDAAEGELWVSKSWAILKAFEAESGLRAVALPIEPRGSEDADAGEDDEPDAAELESQFQAARIKAEGVLKTLRKLRHKAEEKAKSTADRTELERIRGLEAVLVGTLLYVYDSRGDADELLEPLGDAVSALLKLTPAGKDDEAFVDAILGLLNRPSAFLRALATQSFGASSDLIGAGGLQLLIESLVPSEDDIATDAQEDEEMEDDLDGADDAPEEDDAEEDDDDDEESSSETSADSDADNDAEVDPELRSKVLKALQASGIADDDAEDDADSDDSDAESDVTMLDDEQMMKLDDKLAAIFRGQLKGRKAADADEHKEALAQQNKILDLLDAYAARQAGSPLSLTLIRPLLSVMQSTDKDSKQVANRAAVILRSRLGGSSAPSGTTSGASSKVDVQQLVSDLEEVHKVVAESTQAEHIGACTAANTLLVRALLASGQSEPSLKDEVVKVHRESLQALFNRRGARPKPAFVRDVLSRSPAVAWALRDDLLNILAASTDVEREKTLRTDWVKQLQPLLQVLLSQTLQSSEAAPKLASSFLTKVNDQLLKTVNAAAATSAADEKTSPSTYRTKVLRELFKFAPQASKAATRSASSSGSSSSASSVATVCKLAEWEAALEVVVHSERLGTQKAFVTQVQQFVASLRKSQGAAAASSSGTTAPTKADGEKEGPAKGQSGGNAVKETAPPAPSKSGSVDAPSSQSKTKTKKHKTPPNGSSSGGEERKVKKAKTKAA